MAVHQTIEVGSLSEFASQVERILVATKEGKPDGTRVGNWYRGHGKRNYQLVPSLYRHPVITDGGSLLDLESKMVGEFRRQGILHEFPSLRQNESESTETLFYMQHYGVPTRLLDWTSNPFIALYFALTGATKGGSEPASVWVLDPWEWNSCALNQISYGLKGPALPSDEDLKTYRPKVAYGVNDKAQMYEHPVAILGMANNVRMFAQKGVFTMFGRATISMDAVYNEREFTEGCLVELIIPPEYIEPLLDNLLAIGYTDSVAYPDLQGLALEIKRLNGFRA